VGSRLINRKNRDVGREGSKKGNDGEREGSKKGNDGEREGSKKGNDSGSDCGHWAAVAMSSSKVEEAWEAA